MDFVEPINKLLPRGLKTYLNSFPLLREVIERALLAPVDKALNGREIPLYTGIRTMLSPNEREYLYRLAKEVTPNGVIVELGCYAGGSAILLGLGARVSGSHVYSFDPFDSHMDRQTEESDGSPHLNIKKPSRAHVEETLRKRGLDDVITLCEGFSLDMAGRWGNGNINLLWIDGNHAHASQDYYAWRTHLAPDAMIVFHDTNHGRNGFTLGREDTTQSVENLLEQENIRNVYRVDAITAFCLQ
ncbi:class I SAM-dependent methyltransferase [Candidatus Woesearchaeota archaeon]|nr:class I SAM-dependent methyltransferase [Candidatus Woesearchaeota archaeon]